MEAATLWQNQSAEAKFLALQVYQIAKNQLKPALKTKSTKKPAAVMLDLDETVLDNSPYQAWGVLADRDYESETWAAWIKAAQAPLIAGVKSFVEEATRLGIQVFYVSNRSAKHTEDTYQNLVKRGIPVVRKNMLLKTHTSKKRFRRKKIEEKYEILMFFGDTLADFHEDFEEVSPVTRQNLVFEYGDLAGKKYFLLPNPMYGEWEMSLYNYQYDLDDKRKKTLRRNALRAWSK